MEVMLYLEALDRYAEWLEKIKFWWFPDRSALMTSMADLKCRRARSWTWAAREKFARGLSISILQSQIDQQFLSVLVTYWNLTAQEPYLSMYTTSALMRERA